MGRALTVRSEAPSLRALALRSPITGTALVLGAIASVLLGAGWPFLSGLSIAVVWVLIGPALPPVRRAFQRRRDRALERARVAEEQRILGTVSEDDRRRFLALEKLRREIHTIAGSHPGFALAMVEAELGKLDMLVRGFLDLASRVARAESYAGEADPAALDATIARQRTIVAAAEEARDEPGLALARQSLELLERRRLRADELRQQARADRAELNLIENAVRLLRDEVATLESETALREELDNLMASVEAIRVSRRETEELLRGRGPALEAKDH